MHVLSPEADAVVRDLNPWWRSGGAFRPEPPAYQRPALRGLAARLDAPRSLIEVLRGPRQVGKTTGIYQVVRDLLARNVAPTDILFVRFDLELLRDEPSSLRRVVRWFSETVRERPLEDGAPAFLLLDEIHKLPWWNDEVKHLYDTFPVRMLLTGSSSVLVARGGRESLAGRLFTTELPPFLFREVLECWDPPLANLLPPRLRFEGAFGTGEHSFEALLEGAVD